MKKILYIHHGSTKGGAPKSLKFLLEKLDKKVFSPTVVCRKGKNDCSFFEIEGVQPLYEPNIHPFHGSTVSGIDFKQILYNFVYAIPTYFATRRIIKETKPDIIHLNSTCLFVCAIAAKHIDKTIKVVCHVREPLLKNFWGDILKYMNNRYCDNFIAIDSFDGKSVDPYGIKTKVIYNFVDFSTYNSRIQSNILRKELALNNEDVIVLALMRLSPENGLFELICEWKKYIKDKKIHLVIVGEIQGEKIDYSNKCHNEARDNSNIHILPFRSDAPQVIASSDIIICPFIEPHFARVIIEGAAMGVPSIATNIDGPSELIKNGETGFLYNNPGEMADKISILANNGDLRNKLGKNAELLARECFDAQKNSIETFKLYN